MEDNAYSRLLKYALFLLSRRSYSSGELVDKMVKKKFGDRSDVEKVIKRLEELRYLDDAQYIANWIETRRACNPRGELLLKRELKQKKLPEELIDNYLAEGVVDEVADALRLIERKHATIARYPEGKRKQKLFNLLRSRGFKLQTIYRVLDSW